MKTIRKIVLFTASAVLLTTALIASPVSHNQSSDFQSEIGASQSQKIKKATMQTTDNLNLRSLASTKGKILVSIPKGTKVTTDTKVGNWYKVSFKGKTGYVSGSYLKAVTTSAVKPAPTKAKEYKTTANLNVRTTNSSKGKMVITIPKGKQVTSQEVKNGWHKVTYNKKTGWVSGSYLNEAKTASVPASKNAVQTPKAPAAKWMTQSEARSILSQTMGKDGSSFELVSFGNSVISVGFENNQDAKANLSVESMRYISAYEIRPADFGQKAYDDSKASLKAMNASIQSFSDSQLGKGTKEANAMASDIKSFVINSRQDQKNIKTYSGKKYEMWDMGGLHLIQVKN